VGIPDTVYGHQNTATRLQSETADNILWSQCVASMGGTNGDNKSTQSSASSSARSHVEFTTLNTPIPLHAAIEQASLVVCPSMQLIVVTGRSRRLAVENHRKELGELMVENGQVGAEVRKTVGDVATAFVVAGVGSGIVVLQAAGAGSLD